MIQIVRDSTRIPSATERLGRATGPTRSPRIVKRSSLCHGYCGRSTWMGPLTKVWQWSWGNRHNPERGCHVTLDSLGIFVCLRVIQTFKAFQSISIWLSPCLSTRWCTKARIKTRPLYITLPTSYTTLLLHVDSLDAHLWAG